MQEAQAPTSTTDASARRGLRPMAAAAVVAAVVLLGSGIAYLISRTGDTPPTRPAPPPAAEEPTSDPEVEVIAELEALLALKDQAFDAHDLDLLTDVYIDGGAAENRARRALRRLIRFDVYDDGRYRTKEMSVEELEGTQARVKHVYLFLPCFRNSDGLDVTDATGVLEDEVVYTLQRESGRWQIHDSERVAERVVVKERYSCDRP